MWLPLFDCAAPEGYPPKVGAGENLRVPNSSDDECAISPSVAETAENVRVAVIGVGAVGGRAVRQLLSVSGVSEVLLVDPRDDLAQSAKMFGESTRIVSDWVNERPDVVLLAHASGDHGVVAERALALGAHVVSVSDAPRDVEGLLALQGLAEEKGRSVIVGAGFGPGLTDVLAAHGSELFDRVDEVHLAKIGTGGPECARQHHRALQGWGDDYRDGTWTHSKSGSGRELCWFPDPIGAADCYRADLPDARLLHRVFPTAVRLSTRMAATRRDRLTSPLPMLRKPHAEAGPGAVRVELRGRSNNISEVITFGVMDRPSVAAGAVAALAVGACISGSVVRVGTGGMAEMVRPLEFLAELARRGVKAARFEGAAN